MFFDPTYRPEVKIVYQTSIASSQDHEKVIAFLEKQGLLENSWLIRSVSDAFQYNPDYISVVICQLHDELAGVAYILDYRKLPPDPARDKMDYNCEVNIDAVNHEAFKTLLGIFPDDTRGNSQIFRPIIQECFRELPNAKGMEDDFYFTVSAKTFQPVKGENVIELTANDIGLFEGCEEPLSWEYNRSPVFAIIRNGRVATSVVVFDVIPRIAGAKHRVIAVSGLYTETKYRRMGLGKQLVSHVTEKILNDGNLPIYWTDPKNIASQSLAKSLGYWQFGQKIIYRWGKKA